LQEAEKLMEVGIHPVAIVDGYKEAAKKSVAIVDEISRKFYGDLEGSLLKTVDSGRGLLKTLGQSLSHAVGLAEGPGGIDLHGIRIEKKLGGAIEESGLIEGVVIKHWKAHPSMPDQIDLPRVALVNKRMEVKPFEQVAKGEGPFPARLNVTDAQQLRQFIVEESTLRSSMVERVKSSGANLLICRSRIEERVADKLSRQGIFALEKVDQNILDEIARATGARIVGDVNLLEKDDVGTARKLELDKIPPERIAILHCNGAATILLRGGSPELVQELEKVVRRALLVLKHARNNSQVVPGGGAIFAKLSHRLREHALSFSGRQQLGIKAFANALETIPRCLAINYGLDAINIMAQLRASHSRGLESTGVGCEGCLDMLDAGVVELSAIVKTTIWRTFEIASLLLKIDDYFYVKDLPVIHKQ
jgi:chaperonin GroEL (HSP60 family)